MDSECHYFGTGTAATASGCDSNDAQLIAFAAQFVDWFDSDYWSRKLWKPETCARGGPGPQCPVRSKPRQKPGFASGGLPFWAIAVLPIMRICSVNMMTGTGN